MADSKVRVVIDSVRDTLQLIADFDGGKVFAVVDADELFDKSAQVPYPAAGVIYEGIRPSAASDSGKSSHKVGMSCELGVAITLIVENTFPQGQETKGVAIDILDAIRRKFMDTKSPSGHYWRFVLEAPAISKDGVTIWVQRWSTPIILTPTN